MPGAGRRTAVEGGQSEPQLLLGVYVLGPMILGNSHLNA